MTRKIRKHRFKYKHLRIDVEVWYSKTLSIAEMDKAMEEVYPELASMEDSGLEGCAALTVEPIQGNLILVLFNQQSTISEIHHETVHITTLIFNYIGQSHTIDSDELYAYTSTSIFEDIVDVIKNKFKGTIKV